MADRSLPGVWYPGLLRTQGNRQVRLPVPASWQNIAAASSSRSSAKRRSRHGGRFSLVVTLVREGRRRPGEQLVAQLASLRDSIVGGIVDMVVGYRPEGHPQR